MTAGREPRWRGWSGATPSMADSPRERDKVPGGQPRLLIMDVCGAFLRGLGGWIPVGRLVGLMAELGVDEQATRSAVSRMRQRDLLVAESRGGQRGYRLSEQGVSRLEQSDRRIFARPPTSAIAEGWVLVSFSIPEDDRDKRHQLRSRLEWLGFGKLSNGLWLAPRWIQPEAEEMVKGLGFADYVTMFQARHLGFGDLAELVARCWDLHELREMYREFIAAANPVARRARGGRVDGHRAYLDYMVTLHQWRKFPYLDPGLPAELLPRNWEGQRAADLFFEVRDRLERPARQFVAAYCA